MFITQCGLCRKELPDRLNYLTASTRGTLGSLAFCDNCGKPIYLFLKKNGFIKQNKSEKKEVAKVR
jgi:hypothetical protein